MKRIIIDEDDKETIHLSQVIKSRPIFAKKEGHLCGMIVKEDSGWILRIGGSNGATGYHDSLQECLTSCLKHKYEFYT